MAATNPTLPGLHHVTAITGDAQKNLDFYVGVLGQRLVKMTVNFDDPGSYHLYYADEKGTPGSVMTFFAWPGARAGRVGPPQVTATTYAAPSGSLGYWVEQLKKNGVETSAAVERFGKKVISFVDPDGMPLEIQETEASGGHALRGFHGVSLSEEGYERTARLLTDVMGFKAEGSDGNRFRYRASGGGEASVVDLVCVPDARHGSLGAGIVHHVAFRVPDDAQQGAWREKIAGLGFNVSPVMDRTYFHSIYFREPGGVLFEIATNPPGFAADEPVETMGTTLKLPPWLEPHRAKIQEVLPPVRVPERPSIA